jgi:hypothetical protein
MSQIHPLPRWLYGWRVTAAIIVIICLFGWFLTNVVIDGARAFNQVRAEKDALAKVTPKFAFHTVEYEGHKFVVHGHTTLHHPSCPCNKP